MKRPPVQHSQKPNLTHTLMEIPTSPSLEMKHILIQMNNVMRLEMQAHNPWYQWTWPPQRMTQPSIIRTSTRSIFYTTCLSTSAWCPLCSSTSALQSTPCCTIWCRSDIGTLYTASYANTPAHRRIACGPSMCHIPQPLFKAAWKHGKKS